VAHLEASAGAAVRSGIALEALVAGVAGDGVVGSDEAVTERLTARSFQ